MRGLNPENPPWLHHCIALLLAIHVQNTRSTRVSILINNYALRLISFRRFPKFYNLDGNFYTTPGAINIYNLYKWATCEFKKRVFYSTKLSRTIGVNSIFIICK